MEVYIGKTGDQNISLKLQTFRRHMVCLGASGSGKTVMSKVICEEFIRNGVPVIAVDPQGDIASLIECENYDLSLSRGLSRTMIDEYKDKADVVIWTPASSIGVPVSLNPIGVVKGTLERGLSYEESLRAVSFAADSIAALLGHDLSSDEGRLVAGILTIALSFIHEKNLGIEDFSQMAGFLASPPDAFLERISSIASQKDLIPLSQKLSLLTVGVKKLLFELGKPLDIDELLGIRSVEKNKTRLSVIYLNTLSSQEEKEFFIARLASSLYQWMMTNPSNEIQALFYMDEVSPFIPPVRKPACKDILRLLFKQARKYGVGCLIASQNPGDVDYTILSQCSTWCLGRLLTRQDIKKVEQMLKSISPLHCDEVVQKLPSLEPGRFTLFAPDEFKDVLDLRVRWLITRHKTLNEDDIKSIVPDEMRQRYTAKFSKEKEEPIPVKAEDRETVQPELHIDQEIIALLQKERACLTSTQIGDRLGVNPATVRKYLAESGDQIVREKQGKGYLYWYSGYSFLPQYGLTRCVDVARLQVVEQEAIRLAEKRLDRQLIFFEKESVRSAELEYIPLWQVKFSESLEKSFLFFKKTEIKQENIYLHAISGKICIYDRKNGFSFVETPQDNPSLLIDLDDVCTFESIVPGDLQFDWKSWKKFMTEKDILTKISRKFRINVHAVAITFLPVWRFTVVDKQDKNTTRVLFMDGVTGMPMDMA